MNFFDDGRAWNWVDENNVVLGYDYQEDCCERPGWFMSEHPGHYDPCGWDDNGQVRNLDWSRYRFDPDYYASADDLTCLDAGGAVSFRLVGDGVPDQYLYLYNAHNGYYGHGFTLSIGGQTMREETL